MSKKQIKEYVCDQCGNTFQCKILDDSSLKVKFCPICGEEEDFERNNSEYSYMISRDEDLDEDDED